MATQDPYLAFIDCYETVGQIRARVRSVVVYLQRKISGGYVMTEEDKKQLKAFKQKAADAVLRAGERLQKELEQ